MLSHSQVPVKLYAVAFISLSSLCSCQDHHQNKTTKRWTIEKGAQGLGYPIGAYQQVSLAADTTKPIGGELLPSASSHFTNPSAYGAPRPVPRYFSSPTLEQREEARVSQVYLKPSTPLAGAVVSQPKTKIGQPAATFPDKLEAQPQQFHTYSAYVSPQQLQVGPSFFPLRHPQTVYYGPLATPTAPVPRNALIKQVYLDQKHPVLHYHYQTYPNSKPLILHNAIPQNAPNSKDKHTNEQQKEEEKGSEQTENEQENEEEQEQVGDAQEEVENDEEDSDDRKPTKQQQENYDEESEEEDDVDDEKANLEEAEEDDDEDESVEEKENIEEEEEEEEDEDDRGNYGPQVFYKYNYGNKEEANEDDDEDNDYEEPEQKKRYRNEESHEDEEEDEAENEEENKRRVVTLKPSYNAPKPNYKRLTDEYKRRVEYPKHYTGHLASGKPKPDAKKETIERVNVKTYPKITTKLSKTNQNVQNTKTAAANGPNVNFHHLPYPRSVLKTPKNSQNQKQPKAAEANQRQRQSIPVFYQRLHNYFTPTTQQQKSHSQ